MDWKKRLQQKQAEQTGMSQVDISPNCGVRKIQRKKMRSKTQLPQKIRRSQ